MTLKEFFAKARRGRKWGVTRYGQVRCASGFCPLGAVQARRGFKLPSPKQAAVRLNLPERWAYRIADAADLSGDQHRKWLLKNLGLA